MRNYNIFVTGYDLQKWSQTSIIRNSNLQHNIEVTLQHYPGTVIDSQVCFHRWLFADPVKQQRCTAEPVEQGGINKDVCMWYQQLQTAANNHFGLYPVYCVCFCQLLKIQQYCLCPNACPLICGQCTYTMCKHAHAMHISYTGVNNNTLSVGAPDQAHFYCTHCMLLLSDL